MDKTKHFVPDIDCVVDYTGAIFSLNEKTLLAAPAADTPSHYVVPEGVECIAQEALYRAKGLKSIELPHSLQRIEPGALYIHSGTGVQAHIPDYVDEIDASHLRRAMYNHWAYMQSQSPSIPLEDEYYACICGGGSVHYTVEDCYTLPTIVVPQGQRERFYAMLKGRDECGAVAMEMEGVELIERQDFDSGKPYQISEPEYLLTELYKISTGLSNKQHWQGPMTTYKQYILRKRQAEVRRLRRAVEGLRYKMTAPKEREKIVEAIDHLMCCDCDLTVLTTADINETPNFRFIAKAKYELQQAALALITLSLQDALNNYTHSFN